MSEPRLAGAIPAVRAILRGPQVQPKLRVGAADDPAEVEADRVAEQVMRMPEPADAVPPTPPLPPSSSDQVRRLCADCEGKIQRQPVEEDEGLLQAKGETGRTPVVTPEVAAGITSLHGRGQPLLASDRAFFEPRYGRSFENARLHTDAGAGGVARSINARAFTIGRNIAFASGEYRPASDDGRRLLAHELAHVAQQGSHAHAIIRRDLFAYQTEQITTPQRTEIKDPETSIRTEANAAQIEAALASMVKSGTVILRPDDQGVYFSVAPALQSPRPQTLKLTRDLIERPLAAAGFAKSGELADALTKQHETFLYSGGRIISVGMLTSRESDLLVGLVSRPLTSFEASEAQMVYGSGLDLSQFKIVEDDIGSIFGAARTVPGSVLVPTGFPGRSNFMPLLIHELMHEWQYQHGYSLGTTFLHSLPLIRVYEYGEEPGLTRAEAAGLSITDFSTEQQGRIMEDFYKRTKHGDDVAAWMPFVREVRGERQGGRDEGVDPDIDIDEDIAAP